MLLAPTMRQRVTAFSIGLIVLVACRGASNVQTEGCKSDSDCSSTGLTDDCCSQCGHIAGTKTSIEARIQSCRGKSGGPPRCPSLDCPRLAPQAPKCVAGQCTLAITQAP